MARDIIQLPVDGAGKKLDSFSYTQGVNTVYTNTQVIVDNAGNDVDTLAADLSGTTNGLGVSLMATNFVLSTVNSASGVGAQLASGATFSGSVESVWNAQAVSLLVTTDQPGTLILNQYIDAGGARNISSWTFQVLPNIPFSRCYVANGNYFNLSFKNIGSSTTTTLNINTAYGILPASTNSGNFPVSIEEVSGTTLRAFPAGFMNVHADPNQLMIDLFDAALDTTNRWNTPVSGNSGVAAAVATGTLSLGSGTVASGYSYVSTQAAFRSSTPGWLNFSLECLLSDGLAPIANGYRFWGMGAPQAVPTVANPLVNGVGFEVNGSKMYAVFYNNGVRTNVRDLSSTGNGYQPMDALNHTYDIFWRPSKTYFYIDGVVVASTAAASLSVDTLGAALIAVGGATPPVSSAVIATEAMSVSDTAQNASQISDGTYPWRKATVKSSGSLQIQGYQPTATAITGVVGTGAQTAVSMQDFNVVTLTLRTFTGTTPSVTYSLQASDDATNWVTLQGINNATGLVGSAWTQGAALAGGTAGPSCDYTIGAYTSVRVNVTAISGASATAAFGLAPQSMPYEAAPGAVAQGVVGTGIALAGNPVRIGGSDGTLAQDVNVTAKAVQGTRGLAVQDLKDSGRTSVMITASVASTATAETLIAVSKSLGLASTTSASSNTITTGKRFRIQAIVASVRNTTGTVASNVTLRIRAAVAGTTTASSPLQFSSIVPLAASTVATLFPDALIPDGFEIDSNSATNTWGVTITHPQWVTGTQVATFDLCIVGYEY